MLLTIPAVVVLSIWIGVGGCMWPNSMRANLMTFSALALRNKAPNSASDEEDATNFRTEHSEYMSPLSVMGLFFSGIEPKKKFPPAQLCAFGAVK